MPERTLNLSMLIAVLLSLMLAPIACSTSGLKEAEFREPDVLEDRAAGEHILSHEEATGAGVIPLAPVRGSSVSKLKMAEKEASRSGRVESMDAFSSPDRVGGASMPPASRPKSSGLKAGYSDDNRQFNYFINFLTKYAPEVQHYDLDVSERIILRVLDSEGRAVPNAEVRISADGRPLAHGLTYSDGAFMFFPSEFDKEINHYSAHVSHARQRVQLDLARTGRREIVLKLGSPRSLPQQVPLDIVFVLDTTGSMGEEIARLKNTIEIINLNLSSLPSAPRVRFGMVLYKDRGDEYLTRIVPLTSSIEGFRAALRQVRADGGGDEPEDLQAALSDTVRTMRWTPDGLRLAFVITDAPPHLDYAQSYKYTDAMSGAREAGIKLFSVGTGGLNLMGEYILRQIAQYTSGKYIFLTYGERGESAGGRPGSVSHHTGANFATDKLEAIIIQIARDEMKNLSGAQGDDDSGEYISATTVEDEDRTETLGKLFNLAVSQLMDYSSVTIDPGSPVAIFPFGVKQKSLATSAEYFGEQLLMSMSASKSFRVVDRKDIQSAIDEAKFQLSGYVPESEAVEAGRLTGARLIVVGNMYAGGDSYELFLKMLRVETGEVLSVTKLVINKSLGLN